jgi:hypothetical protein
MSSVGRRCRAAQIQGRELEQHREAQLVVLAALPCRGGEEFCLAPILILFLFFEEIKIRIKIRIKRRY